MVNNTAEQMNIMLIINATEYFTNIINSPDLNLRTIESNWKTSYPNAEFQFSCICYRDPITRPYELHQFLPFTKDIGEIEIFLSRVTCNGISSGNGPKDLAGALNLAINTITWPSGNRIIHMIADTPAHERRFSNSIICPVDEN